MIRISENISSHYNKDIDDLRGRNDPEAIKAVVKEVEALFAYEMVKAMRKTAEMSSKDSLGKDIYMSMFDMELSRLLAERGLGLQDILLRRLSKEVKSQEPSKQSLVTGHSSSVNANDKYPMNNDQRDSDPESIRDSQLSTYDSRLPSVPINGTVSSPFGMRKHPISGNYGFHHGVDIAAPAGTGVYPIRRGKVIFSGEQIGYGNIVMIDHGDGFISKYAHNKVNLVKPGEDVDVNTIIAQVGSTGKSTGPHLHFEVRYNGKSADPIKVMAEG